MKGAILAVRVPICQQSARRVVEPGTAFGLPLAHSAAACQDFTICERSFITSSVNLISNSQNRNSWSLSPSQYPEKQ